MAWARAFDLGQQVDIRGVSVKAIGYKNDFGRWRLMPMESFGLYCWDAWKTFFKRASRWDGI